MRISIVMYLLSKVLLIVGAAVVVPLVWSVFLMDGMWLYFLLTILIFIGISIVLLYFFPLKAEATIKPSEGYLIVTCSWLAVVLLGSLPFIISGTMGFTDAFFETMSGFTTTGASILNDVESVPSSMLMWRSLTQWLGGMGIVILFIALMVHFGSGTNRIFSAEAPGTVVEKLTPRLSDTAKSLWKIYLFFTVIQIVLLTIAGMSIFDAMAHTFTTIATGGFSTKNASIAFFIDNPAIQLIIILFMFFGGTNFALFYYFYKKRKLRVFWESEEFKLYLKVIVAATVVVFISLYYSNLDHQGILPITALFQVVSIVTTTGYATVDYDLWPNLARNVMFMLFFVGGSIGSTAGGIKMLRVLILLKVAIIEVFRFRHPSIVRGIKVSNERIDDRLVIHTFAFFFVYVSLVGFGTVIMSFMELDFESALSAVLACIGVIGPGFGAVGPVQNYAEIPVFGKYFLSLFMLLGRLEIFTVLVLFYRKH